MFKNSEQRFLSITKWSLLAASASLYTAAMPMNALLDPNGGTVRGIYLLASGWAGLFMFQFAWLANPLYIVAFLAACVNYYRVAATCAVFAVLIACQGFGGFDPWHYFPSWKPTQLGNSFYVWLAALSILAFWTAIAYEILSGRRRRSYPSRPEQQE